MSSLKPVIEQQHSLAEFDFRVCRTARIPGAVVLWEMTAPLHPFLLLSGPTFLWEVNSKGGKIAFFFAKVLQAILPTLYPKLPKVLPHQRQNYFPDFPTLICPSMLPFPHWYCLLGEQGLRDLLVHPAAPGPPHAVPNLPAIVPTRPQIYPRLILSLRGEWWL